MGHPSARQFNRPLRVIFGLFISFLGFASLFGLVVSMVMFFMRGFDRLYGIYMLGFFLFFVFTRVIAMIHSSSVHCPLCHGALFQNKRCLKHEKARRYGPLGHKSSMVLDMMIRGWYRCMYCGTPFRLN